VKWLVATKHHVEDNTCAPDVNLLVILGLSEDLGGAELDCASLSNQFLALASLPGNIKVQQKNYVICRDQQILRFYISVYNRVLMEVLNSAKYLFENTLSLQLCVQLQTLIRDLV
jgi:hypothetical protein